MTLANKQKVRPEAARLHSFYCRLLLAPRVRHILCLDILCQLQTCEDIDVAGERGPGSDVKMRSSGTDRLGSHTHI